QMVAVDGVRGRRGFLGAHASDLVLRKAIGLKIGEAPVSIAKARSGGRRRLVGLGGLLLPSYALMTVAERYMQFGGRRQLGEQLAIQRDGILVFSEAGARGRVE